MPKRLLVLLILLELFGLVPVQAATFPVGTQYQACFTPQEDCTYLLKQTIAGAKRSIEVQGYTFTSYTIAKALIKAQRRGVSVRVILDKSNFQPQARTIANYLFKNGIPVWQDDTLNIAHNKVMIIDQQIVETGSFNYTVSAQKYNAENMLIIHDVNLAKQYLANWQSRLAVSQPMIYRDGRWLTR